MSKKVHMSEVSSLIQEVLENDGEIIFTITGSSMLPLLRHQRDRVRLIKPQGNILKKYDIPLFVRTDGRYILHRIVAIKPEGYVVVGDNQYGKEFPVKPSQVVGVVNGIWRKGKYISPDNLWYQIYCRLWVFTYPIRRCHARGIQLLHKIKRRLSLRKEDNKNER